MKTKTLVCVLALAFTLCACTASRQYQLPMTSAEATLMYPALASTAQGMGLETMNGGNYALVWLSDGSKLQWQADTRGLLLFVSANLDGLPPERQDEKYRELKAQADHIWETAVETRQKNNIGASVVVQPDEGNGQSGAGQQIGSNSHRAGASGASFTFGHGAPPPRQSAGAGCRSGLDCGSGQFCREWRGGKVCMGDGVAGSPCNSGIDCSSGLWCRGSGDAKVCQP